MLHSQLLLPLLLLLQVLTTGLSEFSSEDDDWLGDDAFGD
jgi:hypothetical protein